MAESNYRTIPILGVGKNYILRLQSETSMQVVLTSMYKEYDGPMCSFCRLDDGTPVCSAIVLEDKLYGICMEEIGQLWATTDENGPLGGHRRRASA